jgi:hypothetical protein
MGRTINNTLLLLLVLFVMFESKAHVNLLNPKGGESFNPGDIVTIQWEEVLQHNTLNWDLLISIDGGITWDTLRSNIPVATLSYTWLVPKIPTMEGRIKVVQDNVDNDYEGISEDFTISFITSLGKEFESIEFNMYPNPITDHSTLEFDNPEHNPHTLTIYDEQGRLVMTIREITTNKVSITRKNLISGIYLFQLSSKTGIRGVGRLVLK